MIIAISTLRAPAEARLEERFRDRPKLVDAHPGFRRLQLVKGRGTDEYLLILEWDSMKDFQSYVKSADFDHAHPPLGDSVEAGGLRVFDLLVDSENGE